MYGRLAVRRSTAIDWLVSVAEANPGSRLVVGASLATDPDVARVPVELVEAAGTAQLRISLPMMRELVGAGRLVHDGSEDLAAQVERARVVVGQSGLGLARAGFRADLLRAASWAIASLAAQPPAPAEDPGVF